MKDESGQALHPSSFSLHPFHSILIGALFLGARIPLLVLRAPFFDELFTHWIAGKSFAGILAALRHDSGPPLYYFVVHLFGDPSVVATRVLSLVCAAIAIVVILLWDRGAPAALLLAAFPPAILFAPDARAYAMCALFVTIAILSIDRDRPVLAALSLVAAAYSHYYGVLFFPLLLMRSEKRSAGGSPAGPPAARRRFYALALAALLYIPGFWLALHQPAEARAWMTMTWPDALFVRPPLALAIIGAVALALSLRVNRYMVMVLVPLILAIGLRVYVPMRFEAIIAAPLVLWLVESLRNNRFRLVLMTTLIAIGILWTALGILDHANRPPDPYRQAALWIAANIPANQTVIASGYCYLETIMNGHTRVTAFPSDQGEHPGWRALRRPGVPAPAGTFFWTGERRAPELGILIRERRIIQPLFINDRAMVALVR
jgi:hypothetical protein